ncbi:hypothetical protein HMPREF1072_02499 [Bacteroides uniformis CL03T00C23]|nr:hypothetical protein HMPREF1072_02499 [Bacteroides uniformis CL03T00C23]
MFRIYMVISSFFLYIYITKSRIWIRTNYDS